MSNLYVNQEEYNFLVNLIEEAMLTCGEISASDYDCADSLLQKLHYPSSYIHEINTRLANNDFRYDIRCKVKSHSDLKKLVDFTDEEVYALKDIVCFAFGSKYEPHSILENADNAYHKVKKIVEFKKEKRYDDPGL